MVCSSDTANVWTLDRQIFRNLIASMNEDQKNILIDVIVGENISENKYLKILKGCPLFPGNMQESQINKICQCFHLLIN